MSGLVFVIILIALGLVIFNGLQYKSKCDRRVQEAEDFKLSSEIPDFDFKLDPDLDRSHRK